MFKKYKLIRQLKKVDIKLDEIEAVLGVCDIYDYARVWKTHMSLRKRKNELLKKLFEIK